MALGCVIRGEISATTPLRIAGEALAATIEADVMQVEPSGRVEGSVKARVLRVEGTIHGDCRCSERIEITGTGEVVGDVDSPRLVIAEGGTLRGRTQMSGSAARAEKDPRRENLNGENQP